MKFDKGKASWDLVPADILTNMAAAMKLFIEMHMLRDDKIIFDRAYLYNVARANIMRWRTMGDNCYLGSTHPLINTLIALCLLAKPREYKIEDIKSVFAQRWDLIDPEWTKNIAEIYAYGAVKYAPDNWKLVSPDRYYSALNRHIDWYSLGETYDGESGFAHLYHAAWNCITLLWFDKKRPVEVRSEIPAVILRAAKKLKGIGDFSIKPVQTKANKSKKK